MIGKTLREIMLYVIEYNQKQLIDNKLMFIYISLQLLKLPRKYTVAEILNEYLEFKHNSITATTSNPKPDK